AFDPRAIRLKSVSCPANSSASLSLSYADINPAAPRTLLLVHGWPSLWASWKFQIAAFGSRYRIIAPDLRGFGASERGDDPIVSMADLAADLHCILADAGVARAACIGHDWGTQTCFEAARQKGPDLIAAVVGITIPYMPYAGPFVPIAALVPQLPHLAYQVYFDTQPATASRELDADPLRSLRATLRTVASP
ncbi:Alpha/Beta hydrolase protein, partial [Vararia minispora EC-137]